MVGNIATVQWTITSIYSGGIGVVIFLLPPTLSYAGN